jgi:DNA-binding IclR family transcriptional regulator
VIQVLNRAFDILELIAKEPEKEFGLGEIANTLNLNHGTCANIIRTMVSRGYIQQMGRRGNYKFGQMLQYLTGNLPYKKELLDASTEIMNYLSKKLNEDVILTVIKDNIRILLHEVRSNNELQVVNQKESIIYNSSTGRVLLACMPPAEHEIFINKYGLPSTEDWPGVNNREDLLRKLNQIRKKKISVMLTNSDIVGVAVPVYHNEKVISSLGVYLPRSRFTWEMKKKIIVNIRESALKIMEKLNAHTNP